MSVSFRKFLGSIKYAIPLYDADAQTPLTNGLGAIHSPLYVGVYTKFACLLAYWYSPLTAVEKFKLVYKISNCQLGCASANLSSASATPGYFDVFISTLIVF